MKGKPRKRPQTSFKPQMTRVEGLLAQLLLHGMSDGGQKKKALVLKAAGLSNTEIAQVLGTRAENVAVLLYQARRAGAARKKGKKKGAL